MRIAYLFLDFLAFIFGERRVLLWCANALERAGHIQEAEEIRNRVKHHE